MKKTNFLNKLKRKGKISIVEESDNLKSSYLQKSESHLSSSKILLENERLEESVSMAYYSMYHSVIALFYKVGLKCENHTATSILLKEIFDIDNSELSDAKRERIDKQYYVDFSISEDDVNKLISTAEGFNAKLLDCMEKLSTEEISKFRAKIKDLLKEDDG